jgi:hypothetical protein
MNKQWTTALSIFIAIISAILLYNILWKFNIGNPPDVYDAGKNMGRAYCLEVVRAAQPLSTAWKCAGYLLILAGALLATYGGLVNNNSATDKWSVWRYRGVFAAVLGTLMTNAANEARGSFERSAILAKSSMEALKEIKNDSLQMVLCTTAKATWLGERNNESLKDLIAKIDELKAKMENPTEAKPKP